MTHTHPESSITDGPMSEAEIREKFGFDFEEKNHAIDVERSRNASDEEIWSEMEELSDWGESIADSEGQRDYKPTLHIPYRDIEVAGGDHG